jgi:hypothetical protein
LLGNRECLFEQKTDEEQRALFDELDHCLRNIDRSVRTTPCMVRRRT